MTKSKTYSVTEPLPKILMVDDKVENLIALEVLLRDIEAQLIRATSGNEALKLSLEHDFALALVDVQMPEMDGLELVELINENPDTQHLPVIFISAIYSGDVFRIRGVETGAIDFLEKPVCAELLVGKVTIFLKMYEYRRNLLEESSRAILDRVSDGVMIVDQKGLILLANPAAGKIMNADESALIGKKFDFPLVPGKLQDISLPSASGLGLEIELNISLIDWHGDESYIVSMRDVTEREESRRQAKRVEKLERELRELQSIDRLGQSTVTANMFGLKLLRENEDLVNRFIREYGELLELRINQRVLVVDHNVSERLKKLGEELVFLKAGPRDIIDIHSGTLKKKINRETNSAKVRAYYEEARILVLELMGNLVSGYRKYSG